MHAEQLQSITYQDEDVRLPRSNIQRIALYALGAGLGMGIGIYGVVRVIEGMVQPDAVVATLLAVLLGLILAVVFFIGIKMALRQATYDLYTYAVDVTSMPLPAPMLTYRNDEVLAMRETLRRAVTLLPRSEVYAQLAHELSIAPILHTVLEHTVTQIAAYMPVHGASLFLFDAERDRLYLGATWGLDTLDPQTTFDASNSALGRALHEQRTFCFTNPQSRRVLPLLAGPEPMTLFGLPLRASNQPIGMLCLTNYDQSNAFNGAQQTFTRSIADILALAVAAALRQQQLALAQERLNAFESLAAALNETTKLEPALEQLLRIVARMTDTEHGTLLLLENDESRVRYRIALHAGNLRPLNLVGPPVLKHGLAGWALRERSAAVIKDTERDTRWLPVPGLGDMRSALAVPLLYGNHALGVLTLAAPHPQHYSQRSLSLACALVDYAVNILAQRHFNPTAEESPAQQVRQLLARHLAPDTLKRLVSTQDEQLLLDHPQAHDVVVIYCSIKGFERLSAQLEPIVLFEQVLAPYIELCSMPIQQQGGYLERRDDAVLLGVFGYPQLLDNGTTRAVDAALGLHAATRQLRSRWRSTLNQDVPISIGMASGPVVAGIVGNVHYQDHALMGATVSRAQRIQALARSGEILIAAEIVAKLSNRAQLPLEPVGLQYHYGDTGEEQLYRLLS